MNFPSVDLFTRAHIDSIQALNMAKNLADAQNDIAFIWLAVILLLGAIALCVCDILFWDAEGVGFAVAIVPAGVGLIVLFNCITDYNGCVLNPQGRAWSHTQAVLQSEANAYASGLVPHQIP